MSPPLSESSKHLKAAIAEQAEAAIAAVDSGRKDARTRLRNKIHNMEKQVRQFKKTANERLKVVQAQKDKKAKSDKKGSEKKSKTSSRKKRSARTSRRVLIPVQGAPQQPQRMNQPQLASFIPI